MPEWGRRTGGTLSEDEPNSVSRHKEWVDPSTHNSLFAIAIPSSAVGEE